jgi:hypothetical protein
MAADPMCMATDMCPKECTTNDDCPAGRECCDLSSDSEKTVICIDKGQCPEKCVHATSECPLGQECCDAGDGLLVCVSASECPGSVPCTQGEVCKNSKGEPNGFECCDVPELGWRCVGSGGCGDWGTCAGDEDCPKGRECCALEAGPTCVPTGACPDQGSQPHACIGACSDPPDEAHG